MTGDCEGLQPHCYFDFYLPVYTGGVNVSHILLLFYNLSKCWTSFIVRQRDEKSEKHPTVILVVDFSLSVQFDLPKNLDLSSQIWEMHIMLELISPN